jgi:nitrogenase molybdenum-iron protein beta chain
LRKQAGISVPDTLAEERGQLVDLMADMHQYFYGKTVALAGDPDQLLPLAEFLLSLDMKVKYVVSGTPGKKFEKQLAELGKENRTEMKVQVPGDLFLLHQWIKQEKVDLLIGNTYAKYIARDEKIPFMRFGFPILDRIGHSYFPAVGYKGGVRLIEKMLDVLMYKLEEDSLNEKFELVL